VALPDDLVSAAREGRLRASHRPTEQDGPDQDNAPVLFEEAGGRGRIALAFHGEQEHVIVLHRDGSDEAAARTRVYSVGSDLLARRPYKGDLHIHSCRSDGKEPPREVPAWCRRIGLDFMAVTDHGLYEPSREAQEAFVGVPVDLRIFRGEEAHPTGNPAHIVNFGGASSVCELYGNEEEYREDVSRIAERLPALPPTVDAFQYASCLWCFGRIRAAGGLSVFCHPYWFYENHYTPSGALTSHLLAERPFDAFELIGGFYRSEADSNTLQVARYHEERQARGPMPIVGSSDAHGCNTGHLFGWYYTVVFAPSSGLTDLTDSIRGLYSVAVEALPGGVPRAYGPFRLVKFALFLMHEVFPAHDALCAEEGELMQAHLDGDPEAAGRLAGMSGRTEALTDSLWGQGAGQ
jgi:hypothetical protein